MRSGREGSESAIVMELRMGVEKLELELREVMVMVMVVPRAVILTRARHVRGRGRRRFERREEDEGNRKGFNEQWEAVSSNRHATRLLFLAAAPLSHSLTLTLTLTPSLVL